MHVAGWRVPPVQVFIIPGITLQDVTAVAGRHAILLDAKLVEIAAVPVRFHHPLFLAPIDVGNVRGVTFANAHAAKVHLDVVDVDPIIPGCDRQEMVVGGKSNVADLFIHFE